MFPPSRDSRCCSLIDEGYGQPCVLNFADAFEPGGLFLQGVTTQEERLARCTGLFWCIKDQPYYTRNLEHTNSHSLYLHDLLYSPDVPVFRDLTKEKRLRNSLLSISCILCICIVVGEGTTYPISIVTCPAPQAAFAHFSGKQHEISTTMKERIRRILTAMANHRHDAVVLGAFGCGAFMNDANMVAAHFKEWLYGEFQGYFKKVVFAVYEREGGSNITVFKSVFHG